MKIHVWDPSTRGRRSPLCGVPVSLRSPDDIWGIGSLSRGLVRVGTAGLQIRLTDLGTLLTGGAGDPLQACAECAEQLLGLEAAKQGPVLEEGEEVPK